MTRFLFALMLITPLAWGASLQDVISDYDQASWQESNADARLNAFEAQLAELEAMAVSPEVLMWRGAVKASIAREKGGVGALKLIKAARKDLRDAQKGPVKDMAGAILANLLAKAPGWPVSVGNVVKAEDLFKQVLASDPSNLIALQGYGELLAEQGKTAEARGYYEAALEVKPRPGREMADEARQVQIKALLSAL